MNILFADNDLDFLNTRADYLRLAGYEVLQACTLAEAEALLRSANIVLAILDTRLQDDDDERDISGLVLAENPEFRHIPKIILTGYASHESARRALVRGPDGIAPAVDIILKYEGHEIMLQAVQQTIDTYVPKPLRELSQPIPPDDLVKTCLQGNCVAFIGAGLSKPAGCPAWREMVEDLLHWSVGEGIIDDRLALSYDDALRSNDVYVAADGIIHTIYEKDADRLRLLAHLAETLQNPSVRPTDTHRFLARLPLVGVLTTNLDSLMEQTFGTAKVYTPGDTKELAVSLAQRQAFVLKLSGDLSRPDTVQITPNQHRDLIAGDQAYAQFIQKLFFARTILFLGASLDGIIANLEAMQCRTSPRQHYALVSVSDADWQAKAELLQKRYNVQVLPYHTSRTHPEVLTFVQTLLADVTRAVGTKSIRKQIEPPRLRHLHLTNIGPFDELEIELDPHWNALLGDNGVGKSNILRAIAFVLCGEDARPYAHRLLRIGEPNGRIELGFADGSVNVAELSRASTGVDLRVLPQREVIGAEQWLAIGFPPLRHVDWRTVNGPQPTKPISFAESGDLLPLIESALDPRVSDLKQTIINLDYLASKESDKRSRSLLRDLFSVVGETAEGMKVHLQSINPRTWQIALMTDSGEVPIEAVSQGTQSLIGWISIMLQRLYDVYGDSQQPRKKPALVMVDEIDAHMHPAWQRTIAPHLMKLFPNIQFIVTTHSPLIVGGVKPDTVVRLRRDEANPARIVADRPGLDIRRWRADQILTSPLFDLPTTLAPEMADALQDYTALVARGNLSPKERERFQHCARLLRVRPPTPLETHLAREAFEKIEAALDMQLQDIPLERKIKLLEEATAQVQENITGSRRPL